MLPAGQDWAKADGSRCADPLEFNCWTRSTCPWAQPSSQDPRRKGWTQQAWMRCPIEALSALFRRVEASFQTLSTSRCKFPWEIVHHYTNYHSNKVFLLATKEISKSKTPLIHQVIPIFDIITTALEDSINNNALPLVVQHAALRGYFMLINNNLKYYSLMDESVVFCVAVS